MNHDDMTQPPLEQPGLGEKLFRMRDYTPLPLVALLLIVARPSVFSATVGTLLMVAGELMRIYSVSFIGMISRTRKASLGAELITAGPFRWVRNPLYVGNFFIVLGVAIFSGNVWFFFLTLALFAWQYHWIVKYEESLLEAEFAETFRLYKEQVPPWLPRRWPCLAEIEWPASFTEAIVSERRTMTAVAAILVILVLKAQ